MATLAVDAQQIVYLTELTGMRVEGPAGRRIGLDVYLASWWAVAGFRSWSATAKWKPSRRNAFVLLTHGLSPTTRMNLSFCLARTY